MFKKNHICKMTLQNNYDLLHDDLQSDFTLKTVVTFHIYRLQMISTSGVLIFLNLMLLFLMLLKVSYQILKKQKVSFIKFRKLSHGILKVFKNNITFSNP